MPVVVAGMVACMTRDEREHEPARIWIVGIQVVGRPLLATRCGVWLGNLTRSLRRSGRFRHWHWLVGNDVGQRCRRGTRHRVENGRSLVLLARARVLQPVGEEVWPPCLVAAPDFGLCMRGAQEGDCEAQKKGSPNSRHGRLRTLYLSRSEALRVKA